MESKEILFNTEYGTAHLKESEVSINIPGAKSYKIAQISDSHFSPWGDEDDENTIELAKHETDFWNGQGGIDIEKNGEKVYLDVEKSNMIVADRIKEINPDFILFSGDIADIPSITTFKRAREYGNYFNCPGYFFPGNHDYVEPGTLDFKVEMAANGLFEGTGLIREIEFDGFDIVSFHCFMEIRDEQLEFLKSRIKIDKPFIIVQHMPILTEEYLELTGPNFVDYYSIGKEKDGENAVEFKRILTENKDKIPAIICGHAHYQVDHEIKKSGVMQYISAPSFKGFYRIININQ